MLAVDVEKRLGDFAIAAKFEAAGGVTALFGPSGSGKTSIVSMIAGLMTPDRGRIVIDETLLFDSRRALNVPAHRRGIGYVFQEGRLFPHMTRRAEPRLRPADVSPAARCRRARRASSRCSTSRACSSGGPATSPAASASASRSAARC